MSQRGHSSKVGAVRRQVLFGRPIPAQRILSRLPQRTRTQATSARLALTPTPGMVLSPTVRGHGPGRGAGFHLA